MAASEALPALVLHTQPRIICTTRDHLNSFGRMAALSRSQVTPHCRCFEHVQKLSHFQKQPTHRPPTHPFHPMLPPRARGVDALVAAGPRRD